MKLFECQSCASMVYFENTKCVTCGHALGYLPERNTVTALEPNGDAWSALAEPEGLFRLCDNAAHDVCNWLLPADSAERFCAACRHNHIVPDTSVAGNLLRWRSIEGAKHRLFYSLLKLRLPMPTREEDAAAGLAFDFLADMPNPAGAKVMTGHDEGLITLALKEADDAERASLREAMHEPYRTLLGHFRHEIGHYYWDRLVRDGGRLEECRAVFGDDSQNYEAALQAHYQSGPPPDWQENYISAYATTHPWEDFAETWAHYLHIVDTLETAVAFGMIIDPKITREPDFETHLDFDPYRAPDARTLVDNWLPLTFAVNSLNRSMGQPDLYPFVLSGPVVDKLQFIHELVQPTS